MIFTWNILLDGTWGYPTDAMVEMANYPDTGTIVVSEKRGYTYILPPTPTTTSTLLSFVMDGDDETIEKVDDNTLQQQGSDTVVLVVAAI
mmetsp:Transcript_45762/g.51214  ORF Transcript_45762/g.51214 Transcript_45762/m.51214 type:complete len:90 (+) Transcript_45762:209-478(+)|eukprot:CAMPEP_0170871784 /NCGR_PEP_ID=MMETSP0734-20130129/26112_1 /TAXON_ID=186038 /ORGANISM="Fragilariopsis kerguelensis, Strain L26-C5" /LENGTH=89 /DNA_ID=CAMNT_0011251315 /DNA_START=162 /DNA_END=431 /DNA_ORIENTATION=-